MTQVTCATCRFYNISYGGRCHRYPPTEPTPTIPKDWWCGEHSAAAATAERDFLPPDIKLTLADPHLEMVQIPPPSGGSYSLISGEGETVAMPRPYWIGKYPVTLRVWRSVMGTSPSQAGGGDDAPVDFISWHETIQFCERLSSMFGYDGSTPDRAPFRLPTEAEWEWAASGGVREDQQVTPETGWYSDNSGGHTHPVGLKDPNAFGLYDTLGNVWEWTTTAEDSYRVLRGGSWFITPAVARVARRLRLAPGVRDQNLGFRLARGGDAMTLDLDALEARLTEYDPDAPGYATLSELLADRLPIDPEETP